MKPSKKKERYRCFKGRRLNTTFQQGTGPLSPGFESRNSSKLNFFGGHWYAVLVAIVGPIPSPELICPALWTKLVLPSLHFISIHHIGDIRRVISNARAHDRQSTESRTGQLIEALQRDKTFSMDIDATMRESREIRHFLGFRAGKRGSSEW